MKNKQPILSICIPTYERPELIKKTIDSILNQNVDKELFEICISDDSDSENTKVMIEDLYSEVENLKYFKINPIEGYKNLIEALKIGNGKFLKLHNDYTLFREGELQKFIQTISSLSEETVVFFGQNNNSIGKSAHYTTFDDFMNVVGLWSSWATSFGLWKDDFDRLIMKNIEINKMFPHVSLLFHLYDKSTYVVDNNNYFHNESPEKKGGYNLPETFGVIFIDLCKELYDNEYISKKTFFKIKNGVLDFIANWYLKVKIYPMKYTFSFNDWRKIIKSSYGRKGVIYIKKYFYINFLKTYVKKMLRGY